MIHLLCLNGALLSKWCVVRVNLHGSDDFGRTSKVWHRLPGAHLRQQVKGCSYGNHSNSRRVGGCPAPSCMRSQSIKIWRSRQQSNSWWAIGEQILVDFCGQFGGSGGGALDQACIRTRSQGGGAVIGSVKGGGAILFPQSEGHGLSLPARLRTHPICDPALRAFSPRVGNGC